MNNGISTSIILFIASCLGLSANAQRVNDDGRKMVKSVRVYQWRSSMYELKVMYTMEYKGKNELVKLSNYETTNTKPTYVYIKNGNTIILDRKKYTKTTYNLNSQGLIVSAEEHEHLIEKMKYNPYYVTIAFTYGENGQLSSVTDKHLYHKKGGEYKENIEDRCYYQCEYKNGGTYYMDGGVSVNGNNYLHPHDRFTERHYDTQSMYDINFNIEASELSHAMQQNYVPMLTEWCPSFPEYWVKQLDFGGNSIIYHYGYDKNGNVTTIDLAYSSGKPYRRYEIEYVY